jgi:hypothetical protein
MITGANSEIDGPLGSEGSGYLAVPSKTRVPLKSKNLPFQIYLPIEINSKTPGKILLLQCGNNFFIV